jgi:hypothetical protein
MDIAPTHANWIPDVNRFNLEAPPAGFLTELQAFDSALVVVPSRFTRRYLLARRRHYTRGLGDVAMLDNRHPDTNMLYEYGLLPVGHLKASGSWGSATLFAQLRARDTWAITGGPTATLRDAGEKLERLANTLDAADAAQEQKAHRDLKESFYHRGRDAWRSMQARLGARNQHARSTPSVTPRAIPAKAS